MKNKGIIILIIAVGLISLAALGLSINKNNNNDNSIVGKWKNPEKEKIYNDENDGGYTEIEVIYEFKEDGTCKINEYDCTYKDGIIAVNDEIFGEYYINIYNNNKLYINVGLFQIVENVKSIGGSTLERID